MSSQQQLTLLGLEKLQKNNIDILRMLGSQSRRSDPNIETLNEMSRRHYSQRLKYPMKLSEDAEWQIEKRYILREKQYRQKKLKVQYFTNSHDGVIFFKNRAKPLHEEELPNPEGRDTTFDNFNMKKFNKLPTSRFYSEALEWVHDLRHQKGSSQPNIMITEKEEQPMKKPERLEKPTRALGKLISMAYPRQPFRRNRSLTGSNYQQLIRQRLLTKFSKGSQLNKTESNLRDSAIELDVDQSMGKLRKLLNAQSGPVKAVQLLSIFENRYGYKINKFQLKYKKGTDELNLKQTVLSINDLTNFQINKCIFDMYDSNKNGVIDEEDILLMMEKSIKFQAIDEDLVTVTRYLERLNGYVRDSAVDSPTHNRISRMSKMSIISKKSYEVPEPANPRSPNRWTLLTEEATQDIQNKKQARNRIIKGDIAINVNRFNEIFYMKRPSIFDDIIKCFFVQKVTSKTQLVQKQSSKKKPQPGKPIIYSPVAPLDIKDIKAKLKQLRMIAKAPVQKH